MKTGSSGISRGRWDRNNILKAELEYVEGKSKCRAISKRFSLLQLGALFVARKILHKENEGNERDGHVLCWVDLWHLSASSLVSPYTESKQDFEE